MIAWYNDIDGPISPYASAPPKEATGWHGQWTSKRVGPYDCIWAHELISEINQFGELPGINPRWATSWEEHAPEFFVPETGLNGLQWPVVTGVENDASWDWWKLNAVRHDVETHRPDGIIWSDDELNTEKAAQKWAAGIGVPALLISPHKAHGLTRGDLKRMHEFVQDVSSGRDTKRGSNIA